MEIDLLAVARIAMVVVMVVVSYHIGKIHGGQRGFLIGLFGVASGKIEVERFDPDDITDPDDVELLEEMLRIFDDEKDDLM